MVESGKRGFDTSAQSTRRKFLQYSGTGAAVGLAGCIGGIGGGGTVRVGMPMPLSGPSGEVGQAVRSVYEFLRDEVVNKEQPDLDPMVLSQSAGLPNHGNAELELIFTDHRGEPAQGRSDAERLIQDENVAMIIGAIFSGVTRVVSQLAAREQVPMVTTSTSPSLTERGLEWLWRPTPHDGIFTRSQFDFLTALEDPSVETAVIVHEDSDFGSSAADEQQSLADANDIDVLERITYTAQELSSFTSQTDVIREADPDVIFQTSRQQDGILIVQTFRDRDYFPNALMAGGALADPSFYSDRQELAQYYTLRTTFAPDLTARIPVLEPFGQLLTEHSDMTFGGVPARVSNMFLTAIAGLDRAGSTDPQDIQSAMNALELEGNEIGAPYPVRFDETGQNPEASGIVVQILDGTPRTVWPFDVAEEGTLVYPAPTWSER